MPKVLEWALNENVDLNWIVKGEESRHPPKKHERRTKPIDEEELERVIDIVEEWLRENRIKTTGKQMVRLITRLANR